ncbi:MAG: LuxR family transcriptional regulator [Verrucomicrobiales bacterium]|nr:LuxR family transcriptional regulator [Verrucomicrobiales bacterium]
MDDMEDDGGNRQKKRRDSLKDAQSAVICTDEPSPPFITMLEDFIWCCFRVDPDKAAELLPPGLRLTDPATAHLAIYRHGLGWGLSHTSGGFLCLVVDGHDSPDTSEAAFNLGGFMGEPDRGRMNRHYAPFAAGHTVFRQVGKDLHHELWSEDGLVARVHSRLLDEPPSDAASLDRYLGFDQTGTLQSHIISCTSRNHACQLLALEFGPAASDIYRALAPTELCWSQFHHFMLTNFSAPEPLMREDVPRVVSLRALLSALGGLDRAALILSPEGCILQRNEAAVALLGGTMAGALGRVDLAGAGSALAPVLVGRGGGLAPLILQLVPLDSALAGPGERLALLSDPLANSRASPQVELLQLLNLTPAEARVASAVGSGLAPREAALRLGLKEATVRSTLKVVFSKLGVGRQAELVRLLGRLDAG